MPQSRMYRIIPELNVRVLRSFLAALSLHSIAESGNMIIMLLAHLQATGDGSLVAQHVSLHAIGRPIALTHSSQYNMIKGWADYLVQNSINPGLQYVVYSFVCKSSPEDSPYRQTSPSDGISGANQTNLSLKGITGIGAMAKISSFMGMSSDASTYAVGLIRPSSNRLS